MSRERWLVERKRCVAEQQRWLLRAECMYSVLCLLRLLLSPQHPASQGVGGLPLLGRLSRRFMNCWLFYFGVSPPASGICCCSACMQQQKGGPALQLAAALFDSQGAAWMLKRACAASFTSAAAANVRVLLDKAHPLALQQLLLALSSKPRQQEAPFVQALLQVLQNPTAGSIIVSRLLHETKNAHTQKGPQGPPGALGGPPAAAGAAAAAPASSSGGPLGASSSWN